MSLFDDQSEAILKGIEKAGGSWAERAKGLTQVLGIPYLAEREVDGKRGPRIEKDLPDGGHSSSPGEILPGEANNSPRCYLDVPRALARLGDKALEGLYYHFPSMNLVLVTSDDQIGIRMIDLVRGGWGVLVTRLVERRSGVT